jgi:hypothetical protein
LSTRRTTTAVKRAEALQCLKRATDYLAAATYELNEGYSNPAASNAVVAIIAAADAVAGLRLARRWIGPHELAAKHVSAAGAEGAEIARLLTRAMPYKNRAQYDIPDISLTNARSLVGWATKAVELANKVASTS